MIETTDRPEEVEKLLVEARARLQAFEDGVDRGRLLQRLKAQSPAHPVLLFRALFLVLSVVCLGGAIVVMMIPLMNEQLARSLAKIDAVVNSGGIPGVPAVLALLFACMMVGWVMTTLAAYSMGRDAQMLPWEQKDHQKLVNEVTRLTTQKAVMERIRGTPAGARPRIATPMPVSLRDRQGAATPAGIGRSSVLGSRSAEAAPSRDSHVGGGRFDHGAAAGGMFGPPPSATPAPMPNITSGPPSGGGVLSRARANSGAGAAPPTPGLGRVNPSLGATPAPAGPSFGPNATPAPVSGLDRRPPTQRLAAPEPDPDPELEPEPMSHTGGLGGLGGALAARSSGKLPTLGGGTGARGGAPLGAAPRQGGASLAPSDPASKPKSRLSAPVGFPGTPDAADRGSPASPHIFGTPPPALPRNDLSYRAPEEAAPAPPPAGGGLLARAKGGRASSRPPAAEPGSGGAALGGRAAAARDSFEPLPELPPPPAYSSSKEPAADRAAGPGGVNHARAFPRWGKISEPWLEEALQKAEEVARTFPEQAHFEFSQETHLPFTLVIARATPAIAVRAMVTYVEFLGSIQTPPRGRIELNNVPHLDRSFHRNVASALEPYFADRFEVEPEIGRVEIIFKEPDPAWQDYPILPME